MFYLQSHFYLHLVLNVVVAVYTVLFALEFISERLLNRIELEKKTQLVNRIKSKLYYESDLAYISYCQKKTNFQELSIAYDIKRN